MKIYTLIFCSLILGVAAVAQEKNDRLDSFEAYKAATNRQYRYFFEVSGNQFATYSQKMRQEWATFIAHKGKKMPIFPEPLTQPVAPNVTPLPQVLPFGDCEGAKRGLVPRRPQKEPTTPTMPEEPATNHTIFNFKFYGTDCKVRMGKDFVFSLPDASENACADAWEKLSRVGVVDLLEDCFTLKARMCLGDWGMIELTRVLGEAYYGGVNEAVFFQMFTLVYAGYQVRLCRREDKLILLVPFDDVVYDYSYIVLDGKMFYLIEEKNMASSYQVFNMAVEGERTPSICQNGSPALSHTTTREKKFQIGGGETIIISPNKNLIDFYNAYPLSSKWNYYVLASLSTEIKDKLYSRLREKIAGKSEQDAVNYLLHFIQKGFSYKTDADQFGYERPLFGDESFFYPHNDCEDRSILLSILVRDLLHLDVVLLHYPQHLSTAIKFTKDIAGSYYNLQDGKYYSCDPTYIGAKAGAIMPEYSQASAIVIRIE